MKINTTPNARTQTRHTIILMLINLEFQLTFLMEVCLNRIIYFFMICANIWSLLTVFFRLIFAHLSPRDYHKPLILTLSSHMVKFFPRYFSDRVTSTTPVSLLHYIFLSSLILEMH